MTVALFDTDGPLAPLRPTIMERIARVVASGQFVLGPEMRAFESELADYLGVRHVIGVANGTDALVIALRALGVRPGDDVVLPALTFYATAEAVADVGARPVFCDVDPDSRNVTVETVKAALTPATSAVIAVDLFGVPAPTPQLRAELKVPVLEDAAQAAGARLGDRRAGALGDVATLSFYPSKNLPCFGDGGAIATDDDAIAETARALRFHGSHDKETFTYVGYNSRLDELQAAILRVQLPHLDAWADGRRAAARRYERAGLGELVTLPVAAEGSEPAWHLYVVRSERADALAAGLGEHGIGCKTYYRTPVHRQPAMRDLAGGVELPATDELARTHLALPMSPVLTAEQADEVVAAARAVLR
jgi:dTDP-4-amino-4,6-dideoxygalactose transaminase